MGIRCISFCLFVFSFNSGVYGKDFSRASPHPSLSPLEVVKIMVEALGNNDKSQVDSGITITFSFASPENKKVTGPLTRFKKMIKGPIYGQMINHRGATYRTIVVNQNTAQVDVIIRVDSQKYQGFRFVLARQVGSRLDGCWMTDSVFPIRIDFS